MTAKLVVTTCENKTEALQIARKLIDEHLAACVNLVPGITSVYEWEGKVTEDTEFLLLIKTTNPAISHLKNTISQIHSYSVPELIVLDISDGLTDYLNWVMKNVKY